MIRHVAVTGGTGFVGQAVCEQLVERSGGAVSFTSSAAGTELRVSLPLA